MNVTKCLNGHFFDADKYQTCPHCGASIGTATIQPIADDNKENSGIFGKKKPENEVEMQKIPDQTIGKTFGIFNESEKYQPVAFSTEERKCQNCGADNSPTAKFCKACGSKIEPNAAPIVPDVDSSSKKSVFHIGSQNSADSANTARNVGSGKKKCPNCGAVVVIAAKFCKKCGTKLEQTPSESVEQISDIKIASESNPVPETVDTPIQEETVEKCSLQEQIRNATSNSDGKTMGFFSTGNDENGCDPVVGWLVCLKGNHLGESFTIVSGRNAVGRGISNKIVLSKDNMVSREKHAWITYDPKHREFYIQPGESTGLSYLNGETLMESKKMTAKDLIEFGNGTYMLVPLCDEKFSWEEYVKE